MFAIGRREVLEQFDFVSARRSHHRELDLSAGHSRNLAGHFPRLMRAMRKLKAENILPKFQRALEIRNGNAGVIGADDARWHIQKTSNAQRRTSNIEFRKVDRPLRG